MEYFSTLTTQKKNAYKNKGIENDLQLSFYLPRKYNDYSKISHLDECAFENGSENIAVVGIIQSIEPRKNGSKTYFVIKALEQYTNIRFNITYINTYGIQNALAQLYGVPVLFMGNFQKNAFGYSVINPKFSGNIAQELKIHPIYRKVPRIKDAGLISDIQQSQQCLSQSIGDKYYQLSLKDAINKIHAPQSLLDINNGTGRIIANDLVYLNGQLLKARHSSDTDIRIKKDCIEEFKNKLPYQLTASQSNVINELKNKTLNNQLIDALIQGDVGCGKTVIALSMMYLLANNGYQTLLMAPTQILANQHYNELIKYVPKGKVLLVSGAATKKQKEINKAKILNGDVSYIVGTQALLFGDIQYKNLGLVVIDEEHKFGVEQRNKVLDKRIHTITMTATPIPRTYANAIYGDSVDVYQITDKPAGRKDVVTYYDNGAKVHKFLKSKIKNSQIYVVCPLVNEADDDSIMVNCQSVEETYEEYSKIYEPLGYRVDYLTGKMSGAEKDAKITAFKNSSTQILISTTVIEIGVNVPTANLIVIQNAERFGLASMHQLRGRVGRGSDQGYCILVSKEFNYRIETMCKTTDGFKISESDFNERKAGNLIGTEQAGYNKLVDEMLKYPEINQQSKKIALQMQKDAVLDAFLSEFQNLYN